MQTAPAPVVETTWWQPIVASLYGILGMLLNGLVKLILFLVIVLIGWFISTLVAKAVVAILRGIKFNALADRLGLGGFTRRMATPTDCPSTWTPGETTPVTITREPREGTPLREMT